jgi:thioredoxin-dependent peroxiredoxin
MVIMFLAARLRGQVCQTKRRTYYTYVPGPWPAGTQKGRQRMARGILVGEQAPDFTLPSQSGEPVRLSDRLGERVVVLYFYPKDNTPGCTAEACAFRDSYEVFTEAGAEVIGVSSDSADRHAAFAGRHDLPFTLLSDSGGRIRKSYRVPAVLGVLPGRVTYVIDRQGTVRHMFNSMTNIDQHVGDALAVVRRLQAEQELPAGGGHGIPRITSGNLWKGCA